MREIEEDKEEKTEFKYTCRAEQCKGIYSGFISKEDWNSHYRLRHGRLGRSGLAMTTRQLTDSIEQLGIAHDAVLEEMGRINNVLAVVISFPENFFHVMSKFSDTFKFGFLFGSIECGTWKVQKLFFPNQHIDFEESMDAFNGYRCLIEYVGVMLEREIYCLAYVKAGQTDYEVADMMLSRRKNNGGQCQFVADIDLKKTCINSLVARNPNESRIVSVNHRASHKEGLEIVDRRTYEIDETFVFAKVQEKWINTQTMSNKRIFETIKRLLGNLTEDDEENLNILYGFDLSGLDEAIEFIDASPQFTEVANFSGFYSSNESGKKFKLYTNLVNYSVLKSIAFSGERLTIEGIKETLKNLPGNVEMTDLQEKKMPVLRAKKKEEKKDKKATKDKKSSKDKKIPKKREDKKKESQEPKGEQNPPTSAEGKGREPMHDAKGPTKDPPPPQNPPTSAKEPVKDPPLDIRAKGLQPPQNPPTSAEGKGQEPMHDAKGPTKDPPPPLDIRAKEHDPLLQEQTETDKQLEAIEYDEQDSDRKQYATSLLEDSPNVTAYSSFPQTLNKYPTGRDLRQSSPLMPKFQTAGGPRPYYRATGKKKSSGFTNPSILPGFTDPSIIPSAEDYSFRKDKRKIGGCEVTPVPAKKFKPNTD